MADYTNSDDSQEKIINETIELYDQYSQSRDTWARQAKEDREFRLGRQWTTEQEETLKNRGQAPIVVNRIHPAVEAAKAILTSNRPSFRVAPREDSDNKVAQVVSALLAYMYDISDGRTNIRTAVDDYFVCGMGVLNFYQDPTKDMGKGEVCFSCLDPMDVYVDPNSRDRYFDDAENVIVSRLFTKEQAKTMYPMYETAIKNAASSQDFNTPETGRSTDNYAVQFPEDVGTTYNTEYVRGYERYYKVFVTKHRVFEKFSGKEDLIDSEEYSGYLSQPAWIVEGQKVLTDQKQVQMLNQQFKMQSAQQMAKLGYAENADVPDAPIEETNYQGLLDKGFIESVQVNTQQIAMCVIMGDKKLYSRVLPVDKYPIIPMMNIHTRTPYPTSDVRMVRGMQEYINKTRSLIIAHATTSTNTKILVPEGSVDMAEFEQKWAQPGVAIPYDPTDGAPMPVQPTPLPNELYHNEQSAKSDIDHQLGLYELMMGNSQAAPQTYKATISIDEFGQRKMKSKLTDIEACLTRGAYVAFALMQQLYTQQKIFRVVQPNNSLNDYVINKKLVDDKTKEIKIVNDITIGKYDFVYVSGSTLPSNRYAELEFYMDAYQKGIIDRMEVLKKTEVFDMEGVLERTDELQKLKAGLSQAQEQIKKLQGDLQTRDREAVNLRKRIEVEKFKTSLDGQSSKAKAATTIYEKRLDDNLSTLKRDIALATKESSPSANGSSKQKKEK